MVNSNTAGLISGIAWGDPGVSEIGEMLKGGSHGDYGNCPPNIALGHYDPIFLDVNPAVKLATPLTVPSSIMIDPGRYAFDHIPDKLKLIISGSFFQLTNHKDVTGLNKDNPTRIGTSFGPSPSSGFPDAQALATKQTIHEWCRLINLENNKYGEARVKSLFDDWINTEDAQRDAVATCFMSLNAANLIHVVPDTPAATTETPAATTETPAATTETPAAHN